MCGSRTLASSIDWVDCATTSSCIADAAMHVCGVISLSPTTTIPAISAHRGAHTMKTINITVTNPLGFIRRRAQTPSGIEGSPQSRPRPLELCELNRECPCALSAWCGGGARPASGFARPAVKAQQRRSITPSPLFPQNEQYVDLTFHLAAQLACSQICVPARIWIWSALAE